jgi:hypothetical protein
VEKESRNSGLANEEDCKDWNTKVIVDRKAEIGVKKFN